MENDEYGIQTDRLRLVFSLLFLMGSIFSVIVALRVLHQSDISKKCE